MNVQTRVLSSPLVTCYFADDDEDWHQFLLGLGLGLSAILFFVFQKSIMKKE